MINSLSIDQEWLMMVIKGSRQGFVSEISYIDSTEVTEY